MTPVEILKAARAKIEKPEHWTQHSAAKDRLGERVGSRSSDAVCWCASGAIVSVSPADYGSSDLAHGHLETIVGASIPLFNDTHTHTEVLQAFDRAIKLAILKTARAKIEKPENWTQNGITRDIKGHPLFAPDHPDAACWCALGAIWSQQGGYRSGVEDLLMPHMGVEGISGIGNYNDTHTHVEVLQAFDKAIAAAEKGLTQ